MADNGGQWSFCPYCGKPLVANTSLEARVETTNNGGSSDE
jgi:hypothetical protein